MDKRQAKRIKQVESKIAGLTDRIGYLMTQRVNAEEELSILLAACGACETRQRAGLDGQCPACANERARRERAALR